MSFETIKEFYELGLWSSSDLQQLVKSNVITEEQFKEIVEPQQVKSLSSDKPLVQQEVTARG